MVTVKCTKEAFAEAMFRCIVVEIADLSVFDLLYLQNAYRKKQGFAEVPIKIQAVMIALADEILSEFAE